MRCSRVILLIDDHVDGLLPAGEAERVRDHLDACRPCRETADAARAASTSLAAWGDLDAPDCYDAILARIQSLPPEAMERPARVRPADVWRDRLRAWAPPALAAAAAVVAAVTVIHRSQPAPRRILVPAAGPVSANAVANAPFGDRRLRPMSAWSRPSDTDPAIAIPRPRAPKPELRPGEEFVHPEPGTRVRRPGPEDEDGFLPAQGPVVVPAGGPGAPR